MTIPVFSVVVPVHNAAATLAATLESVRGQTETDFELVAIDDGSTDASLSILLDFAARDARIRIVSRSNKGVAATRNLGVELGTGSLIAFLDADDIWNPNKLARHRQFHAESPDAAASYARIAFIDSAPRQLAARTISSISPQPLGVIDCPQSPANCAWGGDGGDLYITARTGVYRMRIDAMGIAPHLR